MKLRIKKVNEEIRTVSGFTEFTHAGKESLMENNDNDRQLFYNGKNSINFLQYKKSFKELCSIIKDEKIMSIYNSLIEFKKEHSAFLTEENEKKLTPIIITKINDKKEENILAICAYAKSTKTDNLAHILLSNLNYNGQNSKEIYNYIVDVICEKKLSKIEEIAILGISSLESAGYYSKYEKANRSQVNVLIYKYTNPFYKEDNSSSTKNKQAFDRSDKEKNTNDDISKDNSKLTDKKDKKDKNTNQNATKNKNNNGILKVIKKGVEQGISGANSNKYMISTMYTAYDNEKKNDSRYMY